MQDANVAQVVADPQEQTASRDAVISHDNHTDTGTPHEGDAALHVPVEVCGRIIDLVGMNLVPVDAGDLRWLWYHNENLTTLRSCSLVCRDWYYLTWYHLRQRIVMRNKEDVLKLSRTLRSRPHLRDVVKRVVFAGHRRETHMHSKNCGLEDTPQLETFAAMLAGKTRNIRDIGFNDVVWPIGSPRIETIIYLAAFPLVQTLKLSSVTLSNISQLTRVVRALPRLHNLCLHNVSCAQRYPSFEPRRPFSCPEPRHLCVLAMSSVQLEVQNFCAQLCHACRVSVLAVDFDITTRQQLLESQGMVGKTQTLLDASADSLQFLRLTFNDTAPSLLPTSGVIAEIVEQSCNLSRFQELHSLEFVLGHPCARWLHYIPPILSLLGPQRMESVGIGFKFRRQDLINGTNDCLRSAEESCAWTQVDDMLQEQRFSTAVTTCCLDDVSTGTPDGQILLGLWDELVRRKMPRTHRRGTLWTSLRSMKREQEGG